MLGTASGIDDASNQPDEPRGGADGARILIASNRGPVSFAIGDNGALLPRRGAGGLVSGLSSVGSGTSSGGRLTRIWVCAALTDGDRAAARLDPHGRLGETGSAGLGIPVRMLDIDPDVLHRAYNAVANSTLWFIHHMLYSTPSNPAFAEEFAENWAAYQAYNAAFADALAEEAAPGARVLVQDYHLCLVPKLLRDLRPDLKIGHFSHTPWAPPDYFRILPDSVGDAILEGMLGADYLGFLADRWAHAFTECCARQLGATGEQAGARLVVNPAKGTGRGRPVHVGVHALGVDAAALVDRAQRPDVAERLATLRAAVGEGPDGEPRQVIVRVDRTELSKNIVRGLEAYALLLRRYPSWRGRVVHVAFAYPSRTDLVEYRDYTSAVTRLAKEIEEEFAQPGWQPLILHVEDDFARSLAAYRLADVAVVNPIRDGMNLVAKEIPIVAAACGGSCALVLSREAGAAAELSRDALTVNPFDVSETAEAMHTALSMDPAERRARCERLAASGASLPPGRWLAEQLDQLREDGLADHPSPGRTP